MDRANPLVLEVRVALVVPVDISGTVASEAALEAKYHHGLVVLDCPDVPVLLVVHHVPEDQVALVAQPDKYSNFR